MHLDSLTVADVAAQLVTPDFTEEQARNRFRRFVSQGIIPSMGRIGRRATSANLYPEIAVPAARVLFALTDAEISSPSLMGKVWDYLMAPALPGEPTRLESILEDVAEGGQPFLAINSFEAPNFSVRTVIGHRLSYEHEIPFEIPETEDGTSYEILSSVTVQLGQALKRWAHLGRKGAN